MTDLIYIEDLTKNTTRFDMLDADTRRRLAALAPSEREYWYGHLWHEDDETVLHGGTTYRQKPTPKTVVNYHGVFDWGIAGPFRAARTAQDSYPTALSFIRIETCAKTGKLIRAENVEVGDE